MFVEPMLEGSLFREYTCLGFFLKVQFFSKNDNEGSPRKHWMQGLQRRMRCS